MHVEEAVRKTEDHVVEGETSSKEVYENFKGIISSAELVDSQINTTLKKAIAQSETSQEISKAIESIAFATTETASNTKDIKESTTDLKENIGTIVSDLSSIVELTNEMFNFKKKS